MLTERSWLFFARELLPRVGMWRGKGTLFKVDVQQFFQIVVKMTREWYSLKEIQRPISASNFKSL